MIYRLDPDVPLVWRDPRTLQLGVDRVHCVFVDPTPALEQMLLALRTGAPRSVLEVAASGSPASRRDDVDALLTSVSSALLPGSPAMCGAVVIDGDGVTAERLTRLLLEAGHRVVGVAEAADQPRVVAAVIIGSYVIAPWRHGPWLRRDIPHLPVVFGDDGVEIGPFVDDGPCLRCLSLKRTDEDSAWPAISAQLDAGPPAPEPPLLRAEAVAIAARWVDACVRRGDRSHAATSIRIDADGRLSEREHSPHATCGCRALPENVTALAVRRR